LAFDERVVIHRVEYIAKHDRNEPGADRFRAKREQLRSFKDFEPDSQGLNLALTVSYVPYSLDSGVGRNVWALEAQNPPLWVGWAGGARCQGWV